MEVQSKLLVMLLTNSIHSICQGDKNVPSKDRVWVICAFVNFILLQLLYAYFPNNNIRLKVKGILGKHVPGKDKCRKENKTPFTRVLRSALFGNFIILYPSRRVQR